MYYKHARNKKCEKNKTSNCRISYNAANRKVEFENSWLADKIESILSLSVGSKHFLTMIRRFESPLLHLFQL